MRTSILSRVSLKAIASGIDGLVRYYSHAWKIRAHEGGTAFLYRHAHLLQNREDTLGTVAADGPTAAELMALAAHAKVVIDDNPDVRTLSEAWELYRHICFISDKWLFPENDPIGVSIVPFIEGVREKLGIVIDTLLPDSVEIRQKFENVRTVARVANRAATLENTRNLERKHGWLTKVRSILRT
jgi:hypothetical protein